MWRFHDNYWPIVNLGQNVLESVTTLFKLVAFKLCTVYIFQSVLPLLLFSSYPLPILTMHHTIAQMLRSLNVCLPAWNTQYGVCRTFRTGWSDADNIARTLIGHNSKTVPVSGSINCRIHHVTVSIATRKLITNLGQINLVSFKMQVYCISQLYQHCLG